MNYEEHHHRYRVALEKLLKAERETEDLVSDVARALEAHEEAGKALKEQATALINDLQQDSNEADPNRGNKGKGRADNAVSEEGDGLLKNAAGEEHLTKRRAIQQRLRECQITLHRVYFLKGDVYHILERSDEEAVAYEKAEELRRVLLRSESSIYVGISHDTEHIICRHRGSGKESDEPAGGRDGRQTSCRGRAANRSSLFGRRCH
jgi:E3 ubiquitin-protein ligase SHPRH